jgi:2-hydroxychromene-2-carboxylate isomerase
MKGAVTFYFGPGSRYSYLASTQLPRICEETGARFIWRAVYSPELIARAGSDPFHAANRRGQYRPEYRAKDVQRWAALYGIPYSEPDWNRVNWRRLASLRRRRSTRRWRRLREQLVNPLFFWETLSPGK